MPAINSKWNDYFILTWSHEIDAKWSKNSLLFHFGSTNTTQNEIKWSNRGNDKHNFERKNAHQFSHMFWVIKRTVLLSTHNIWLGCEITKYILNYSLLSRGLLQCIRSNQIAFSNSESKARYIRWNLCMKLNVADISFMVYTSEKNVSRDFWSFIKLFHRIGHCSISWNLFHTFPDY